jgi:superfamily II DNA/RNA helicase
MKRTLADISRNLHFVTGTGCIVISPTRELSMQTFGVLKELMKYHHHTYGLLMGGANRQTEVQKLSKGKERTQCFMSKKIIINMLAEAYIFIS